VSKSTIKRKLRQLGYSKRVVAKKMGIREVNRKKTAAVLQKQTTLVSQHAVATSDLF
jgi:hypothetical protein